MAESAPVRMAGGNKKAIARKLMLTKTIIDRLTVPPDKRDVYIYDRKVPGLAYRLTANGSRSWYLIRRIHGRPNRLKIGSHDMTVEQARIKATSENGRIADGANPVVERQTVRQSATLGELWKGYMTKHLMIRGRESTITTEGNRWKNCFTRWANRKALAITESDVRGIHSDLAKERGPITANRAVQMLRAVYNWGRLGHNPVGRKSVNFFREISRERFLQPDELPRLFKALDSPDTKPLVRDFIYMSLFTGARRSNVAAMRVDEINLSTCTWIIPAGKSKNKRPMNIPLSAPAMTIVKARLGNAGGYLFPGSGKSGHLQDPKATWQTVLERAGLKDLRLHDLRRTLGSWQAAAGSSLAIIGASLGHADSATTQIYARLNLDPVRASVSAATEAMLAAATVKTEKQKEKRTK